MLVFYLYILEAWEDCTITGLSSWPTGILASMVERSKTAIVLVGGSMKSAHGAGFLYALEKDLRLPRPDIMIASSGDAANLAYYCSGQVEEMKRIWLELLSTPKFISLWHLWRVMNVDYLVDEVFKKQAPLDVGKLLTSPIEWFVPLSDFATGKTLYASAKSGLDPFEMLRAAKAIPFLFGKRIPLHRERYIDGELGPILQDHVDKAVESGARNIVIVNHTYQWTLTRSLPMRLYSILVAQGMHDAVQRDVSTDVTAYHAAGARVILLNPTNLPCGSTTTKKNKLKATFDRGVADALALRDELRGLFA